MKTIKIINPEYFAKHPEKLNSAIDVVLPIKSQSATIYPDKIVLDSEDNDSQADDSKMQNKGYIEPVGVLKLSEAIDLIFASKIHQTERKVFQEEVMGFIHNGGSDVDYTFKKVETILKFCDKTKTLPSSLFLLAELLGGLNDYNEFVDPVVTTIWQNYDHNSNN